MRVLKRQVCHLTLKLLYFEKSLGFLLLLFACLFFLFFWVLCYCFGVFLFLYLLLLLWVFCFVLFLVFFEKILVLKGLTHTLQA